MEKRKVVTPYQRLLDDFREYFRGIEYAHRKTMWVYPSEKIKAGATWDIGDLRERVIAADQLGYDVLLLSTDEGLIVQYRKKPPVKPWNV